MATYYIGPSGNNANPGTAASPKALSFINSLIAGDEALLLGGTYRQQLKITNRIGTAANRIYIAAADATPVIIDGGWDGTTWPTLFSGANYVNMYRYNSLLSIENSEWLDISGINVRNSSGQGIDITMSKNIILYDCTSDNTFGGALLVKGNNSTPGVWYGPHHVYDCEFTDVTLAYVWHKQTAPDGTTFVNSIQTGVGITDYVENVTVERCVIHRCGAEGMVAGRNSRFIKLIDCDAVDTRHTGFYFQCSRNSLMDRCLLLNTDAFVTAQGGRQEGFLFNDEQESLDAPFNSHTSQDNIIRNSIAVNSFLGVRFGSSSNMVRHTLENNSFINCERPYSAQNIQAALTRATPAGNIVQNNLLYNNGVAGSNGQPYTSGFTFRDNLFFGTTVPANANGAGTLTSNPQLASPNGPYSYPINIENFRPLAASPAVDAGFANSLTLDHTKRTRSGAPDIGALEFAAATAAPVANFFASQTSGNAPLTVAFTDTSVPASGTTITAWEWEYSTNGTTWTQFSTAQNPTFNFPTGCYQVRLTVTDSAGATNTKVMTGS